MDHKGTRESGRPPRKVRPKARTSSPSKPSGSQPDVSMAGMEDLPLAFRPTRPQLVSVGLASLDALSLAVAFAASTANLGLSARDVGGLVMPPGMIMLRDTPGEAYERTFAGRLEAAGIFGFTR